jgi:phenylacetate-CoA ligase
MRVALDRLYASMPAGVQHLLCSVEGYRIERTRFDRRFDAALSALRRQAATAHDTICRDRDERLERFVREASTAPFYAGTSAYRNASRVSLAELPILGRAVVQSHATAIARRDVRSIATAHTSGSTGTGLRFPVTRESVTAQWATWWRYREWHGIGRDEWCGYFGGRVVVPPGRRRPPYWRYNVPGRQILFSQHHLGAGTWRLYVDELRRRRPRWLHGYPSMLALLASFVVEHGSALDYRPTWVTVGAESLLPAQAALIQRAFGVTPRQHYGMAEGVANASECPDGRLHVDEDFAFVEFVPALHGGHHIVGTNLANRAFPLIRYDTGDIAHLADEGCPCGRPGRIVARIDGRREDYVMLPDGGIVGRLDHIFKDQTRVREAQVYQPHRRRVVLRVVQGSGFDAAAERSLLRAARAHLGSALQIDVEYRPSIPRTGAGKLRFVVSDLPPSNTAMTAMSA